MKRKMVVTVLIAMLGALVFGACSAPAQTADVNTPNRQINVTGSGEVYLDPDIAYITVGVHSESENAETAVDENNVLAQAVKDALIGIGIDEKDIQTTSFNVYWSDKWQPDGITSTKIYVIDNMMDVTIRNFDDLGKALDAALAAGSNNIYNIRFDVADKGDAYSKARTLAVQNAQKQAAELAVAAGVELGDLVTISSYGSSVTPISSSYAYGVGGGGSMAESAQGVPVSSGQLVVSVSVNLVYDLNQ